MSKVLIFGNSASGKTTLAKKTCALNNSAHLDLDTIAWQATSPPTRMPLSNSQIQINSFTATNDSWVIEGCYSDLIKLVIDEADQIIFLNLSVEACILNAKNRSWEPHKYESKKEQDSNLEMLINWISEYSERDDNCSQKTHTEIFNTFTGNKLMHTSNI